MDPKVSAILDQLEHACADKALVWRLRELIAPKAHVAAPVAPAVAPVAPAPAASK